MKAYKVLIFIACVMAGLAALCVVLPHRVSIGAHEVRWPTLAEVFNTPDTVPADTLLALEKNEVEPLAPEVVKPVIPKVVVDSTTDSRVFLSAFYASLPESADRVVRVLHYGDSQIEEDRMTQQIREALQARFGGGGVGLMPLAQTIPTLTVKQQLFMSRRFVAPAQGPQRHLVYGPRSGQRANGLYGPMGQMAVMNDSLVKGSEEIMAVCTPQAREPRYTEWKIFADTSIHYTTSGDTVRLNGRGDVYGLSQQTSTGIIVDNIPMRGCLGLVFTKMDSTQLTDFYRDENVRLIIMQFGGNAIPFNKNPRTIGAIVHGLREQVQYLQRRAPGVPILFIGPSDMLTQEEGVWQTYPMVPYMDKLLRKMALEENIAYFSLYRWMGGRGSMMRWQEVGLAGSDGVHFTRAGARKAGNAVVEWLLEGMNNEQRACSGLGANS